jgi:type IV fimbrial biogenesis protein FimT
MSKKPFVCLKEPFIRHEGAVRKPFVCPNRPPVHSTFDSRAFTLVELVITLSIAGILALLAVPAITGFVQSNRLATLTNELITDFNTARSEAIKRGTQAIVCESTNGTSCTSTGSWNQGWIVFADVDDSGTWTQTTGREDVLIRTHAPVPESHDTTPAANMVIFNRQGAIASGSGSYEICNSKIGSKRTVILSAIGRVTITEDSC